MTTRLRTIALLLLLGAQVATAQPAADSLAAARQLYASADYDEALAMLERVERSGPAADPEIPLTRALCLVGLGRDAEAKAAMARLVDMDPTFEFGPADASPRVRDLLHGVRAERLPAIVQERYATAKRAFDRGDFNAAGARFADLRSLLDDPLLKDDARLADFRTLTQGFADLASKLGATATLPTASLPTAATQATPPPATAAPLAAPAGNATSAVGTTGNGGADTAPSMGQQPRVGNRLPDTPPQSGPQLADAVALSQRAPEWPPQLGRPSGGPVRATILVVIDEAGNVSSARTLVPVNPVYDALLLDAARRWKYQPATENGRPIPFTKVVSVLVGGR